MCHQQRLLSTKTHCWHQTYFLLKQIVQSLEPGDNNWLIFRLFCFSCPLLLLPSHLSLLSWPWRVRGCTHPVAARAEWVVGGKRCVDVQAWCWCDGRAVSLLWLLYFTIWVGTLLSSPPPLPLLMPVPFCRSWSVLMRLYWRDRGSSMMMPPCGTTHLQYNEHVYTCLQWRDLFMTEVISDHSEMTVLLLKPL